MQHPVIAYTNQDIFGSMILLSIENKFFKFRDFRGSYVNIICSILHLFPLNNSMLYRA